MGNAWVTLQALDLCAAEIISWIYPRNQVDILLTSWDQKVTAGLSPDYCRGQLMTPNIRNMHESFIREIPDEITIYYLCFFFCACLIPPGQFWVTFLMTPETASVNIPHPFKASWNSTPNNTELPLSLVASRHWIAPHSFSQSFAFHDNEN